MKFFVVFSVVLACAAAAVDEANAPIVKAYYENDPEGNFQYAYETGNGILAQVQGEVKNVPGEGPSVTFTGGYKYTSPDGTPVEVSYVANENGFQPQGSHLPVPPAIPEAIVRSLAYIAEHPPPPSSAQYQTPKPQYG